MGWQQVARNRLRQQASNLQVPRSSRGGPARNAPESLSPPAPIPAAALRSEGSEGGSGADLPAVWRWRMDEARRQIGPELSTLSTPPTVRTSVETEEQANASSSGSGPGIPAREGGSGGEPFGAVDTAWARALFSAEACKRGVCAYRDPEASRNGSAAANGCDGYHASRGVDVDGRPVVRWGLCPRHRAWWVRERVRRAAMRAGL